MENLLQNIISRRADIESKASHLKKQLDALYNELSRLDKMEAAAKGKSLTVLKVVKSAPAPQATNLTIKEMAVRVLVRRENGLTALSILYEINKRYGKNLARTSLSPQLSRLRQEGKIYKDGKNWLLTDASLREEPM